MKINNKFAIGCLVQWYEIEIIGEYIESLKQALEQVENSENIIVDFTLTTNQTLEQISDEIDINVIRFRFQDMMKDFDIDVQWRVTDELVTIADYRREFNDKYCEEVDVLMWGETDSLIPKQTFEILDGLHSQVKEQTPKYTLFFSTCKMWDDSWKVLEHPEFTDKPFYDKPEEFKPEHWWSLRYTMSVDEMNSFNDKVEHLDVQVLNQHKFNGCGLVFSSEVVKSGVNIPKSVFFVHEDTAFMVMIQKVLGMIPQFLIKNILLVHNRNHPKKRMYVKGESTDGTMNEKRRSNEWYVKANEMSERNCYNFLNPKYKSYTWEDVWKKQK
tara:strand:+ start:942 stop:1925 length:984 start_codon:yes stop_codon:yes gene_type:complete